MTHRFLIVRLSAIGDAIHTLPLAAALKKLYPDCFLGWVVEAPASSLVVNNPLVDWHYILPKRWLKRPSEVLSLRRTLREQRFDTAFDVQGLSKSAVAAWLSGAPTRIGFQKGEAREIAPWLDNRLVTPRGRHAVDITLSLLDGIGASAPGAPEFVFPRCNESDASAIAATLSAPPYRNGFILMGPWGSFEAKLWPLERFGELAQTLRQRTGLPSLMLGHGDRERTAVTALCANHPDLAPAPDVDLPGVAELARRASLFVGCDSFPMHAAAGVGCPTLGLFGVTDPERLGPYGPRGRGIYHALTLVRSTRERAQLGQDNLLGLSVEAVADAAVKMPS